jgi:hypothetical protein
MNNVIMNSYLNPSFLNELGVKLFGFKIPFENNIEEHLSYVFRDRFENIIKYGFCIELYNELPREFNINEYVFNRFF